MSKCLTSAPPDRRCKHLWGELLIWGSPFRVAIVTQKGAKTQWSQSAVIEIFGPNYIMMVASLVMSGQAEGEIPATMDKVEIEWIIEGEFSTHG